MNRISAVSVIALALAGCVNMAPDHERPALASPAVYAPEYRPDGTVTAGSPQSEFVAEALRLIADKKLLALPGYLGTALWGFATRIEIPRGSGELCQRFLAITP